MSYKLKLDDFKSKYKANPAWYWLLFTVFSFFLLPEYVSPFILFAAYIIFKRQWTREGRLAKVGNIGKIEMAFMAYMLISVIWSPTKLDTLGCAGLWWAVFLIQIMIYNLARTKLRIKKVIEALVASAAINGAVGFIQIATFVLAANGKISRKLVLVTPFYRYMDKAVYEAMPFDITTSMWRQRASGFFSNPNLLATFMIVAFPLAIYLFIDANSKKGKRLSFLAITCISAGTASTMTRAGCYVIILAWATMFVFFIKKHAKSLLLTLIPTAAFITPSMLVRYGKIILYPATYYAPLDGLEALQSSAMHFKIWQSVIDYIIHHIGAFFIGTGFGMERTGDILLNLYGLNKPHSHNFIIELWIELGIIGVAIIVFIIAYAIGKLLEIDIKDRRPMTLTVSVLASFVSLVVFGLSDYIFNSPKQIILFMILIGIIQAISYTYEKHEINSAADLTSVTKDDIINLINQ